VSTPFVEDEARSLPPNFYRPANAPGAWRDLLTWPRVRTPRRDRGAVLSLGSRGVDFTRLHHYTISERANQPEEAETMVRLNADVPDELRKRLLHALVDEDL